MLGGMFQYSARTRPLAWPGMQVRLVAVTLSLTIGQGKPPMLTMFALGLAVLKPVVNPSPCYEASKKRNQGQSLSHELHVYAGENCID